MMCQSLRCLLIALLVVTATAVGAAPAFAQSEHDTALDSGSVVRHKILYRSTRFEAAPLVGMTLNDSYIRNLMAGVSLSYHLTNEWGLNLVGAYGVAQFDTEMRENTEAVLNEHQPSTLDDLSYSHLEWLAGLELSYVPLVGKFSMFNSVFANYDIHLIAGFAFVNEVAVPAVDGQEVDAQLEGLRPAPVLGVGARLFLSDWISANLQVRDYLYTRAEVSTHGATPEFRNNIMVTGGFSFFLPTEASISR